jgi:hypothetical protein
MKLFDNEDKSNVDRDYYYSGNGQSYELFIKL